MQETLTTSKAVIKALGGISETAALTGSKYNAVVEWGRAGRIPPKLYLLLSAELERVGKQADPAVWGMVERDRDGAAA